MSKHFQTHLELKWRLWCFNGYAHNTIITTKYNNADKYFHHLAIAVLALYWKVSNYYQQVTGTNVNVFILEHLAPLLSSLHLIQLGFFLTLVLLTQSLPLSLNVLHSQKHSQLTSDMDTLCNKNWTITDAQSKCWSSDCSHPVVDQKQCVTQIQVHYSENPLFPGSVIPLDPNANPNNGPSKYWTGTITCMLIFTIWWSVVYLELKMADSSLLKFKYHCPLVCPLNMILEYELVNF